MNTDVLLAMATIVASCTSTLICVHRSALMVERLSPQKISGGEATVGAGPGENVTTHCATRPGPATSLDE